MTRAGAKRAAPKRKKDGRWAKGVSGNPAGRPKSIEPVRSFITERSVEIAEVLYSIVMSPTSTDKDKTAAGRTLLDYVLAKPRDPSEKSDAAEALEKLAAALTAK